MFLIFSGDDDLDDHDTDSLDIKPPQATIHHSRDTSSISRRRERSIKDKKHSRDRRQHRDRSDGIVGAVSTVSDRERERDDRIERDRRPPPVRDERADMERYQRSGGYERNDDSGREIINSNERRYQKHYDRGRDNHGHLHHNQQHMHRRHQQQEYYERGNDYHHGGNEYHTMRQYNPKHAGHRIDYGHEMNSAATTVNIHRDRERERERERSRKYTYEAEQQDAESLEQDLRSRLLSKRHKYVKDYEPNTRKHHVDEALNYDERNERSYEEQKTAKIERHRSKREKERDVIEVFDSPEVLLDRHQQSKKHKRREKSKLHGSTTEKRKSPEDPELIVRRAKLLEAEREITKQKEVAREELEARREKRRERAKITGELSPTAVVANVTAGLNVIKRRKNSVEENAKRKKAKKSEPESDDDDADDTEEEEEDTEEENDVEEESNTESESEAENQSDHSHKKSKTKKKHSKEKNDEDSENNDDVVKLPESPLSIGELSKSPSKRDKKKHRRDSDMDDDDVDDGEHDRSSRSHSRSQSHYESCSRSASRTSLSRSRSRSHSASHSSHSRSRSRSRSSRHSRSNSGSYSAASRSRSRSRSHSHTRSRSRSEERDMKANLHKSIAEERLIDEKRKSLRDGHSTPPRDEKGVPLPNYFPGIQGCRSVEEFQCLNRIEEGTYGVVYRAKDKRTNEIVALKRLKMEKEKEGFPITSLREINTLLKGQHPNIVTVREIVVGSNMDKIFVVMDYVEHDLKSLMETMKNRKQSFLPGEVKCLTQQLLRAVGHLHDNWILHRDLKTSNLLLSHKGILKVGDFGLAREYGSPLKKYTSLVVTLWYRAPELLLCSAEYSTPIDIWSVGCIYAEFLQMAPLFPGKTEIDELNKIFKVNIKRFNSRNYLHYFHILLLPFIAFT